MNLGVLGGPYTELWAICVWTMIASRFQIKIQSQCHLAILPPPPPPAPSPQAGFNIITQIHVHVFHCCLMMAKEKGETYNYIYETKQFLLFINSSLAALVCNYALIRVKGYKTHWTMATEVFISAAFLSRSSASWACMHAMSAASTSTQSGKGHTVDPALKTRPNPKQWHRVLHEQNCNLQCLRKTHHTFQTSSVLSWNNFKILPFCKVKLKLFTKLKEVQFGSSWHFKIQKIWNLLPKELQELIMCLFAYLTSTLFFIKLNTATNFEFIGGSILISQHIMSARQHTLSCHHSTCSSI